MKMVSASKFTKAERDLKPAKPFGYAARKFYESTELIKPEKKDQAKDAPPPDPTVPTTPKVAVEGRKPRHLYIAITSDRGLCGGVHSGIARRIRRDITELKAIDDPYHRVVAIGDKARGMLRRVLSKNMLMSVKDIGRIAPTFNDAAVLAAAVAESNYRYDVGNIYYNKYFTPVKYELTLIPLFSKMAIEAAPKMTSFDDVESETILSYSEWTLAALLYYVLKESAAAEQSARMAAMDNASKNANEMIRKLQLLYNRTRQAVITRELIEIISGAAALV
ncbi:ATP synthase domain-containing protein [Phthorimaea operculella]|nr:ATP synthase domain-containing protein [Phthorimaea operculella]